MLDTDPSFRPVRLREGYPQLEDLSLRWFSLVAQREWTCFTRYRRTQGDKGSSRKEQQMSDLIVIGYENPQTARQAYEQVQRLQQDFVVDLRGLAIVNVDADGKTHVDTPQRIIGTSAVSGALFGLLLGLLFFVPGMVLLGGALGALMGTFNRSGVNAEFRNRVEHLLEPGHSAVVIMASKITEDKFASAMQPFGGTILKTSLSESDEKELAEELTGQS